MTEFFDEAMETMPPADLASWQDDQFWHQMVHAYEHALVMRRIMDAAGITLGDVGGVADRASISFSGG